jgi:beta-glucosidase
MALGEAWRPPVLAGACWLLLLLPWASAAVRRSDFPASFLFGTATSSYQVR